MKEDDEEIPKEVQNSEDDILFKKDLFLYNLGHNRH